MPYQLPDDPMMDAELAIGTIVHFTSVYDLRDRPIQQKTALTVFRVGSSRMSFDYGVRSESGNEFYVRHWEICFPDGSPVL